METGSDHEVIEWRWMGGTPGGEDEGNWRIKGWALKEALDKGKEEAKEKGPKKEMLEMKWQKAREAEAARPILSDESAQQELEDEIRWLQKKLVSFLDENVRKITICARSKRWWNKEIEGKRKELGKAKRRLRRQRRKGSKEGLREEEEAVREAGRALRNEIRRAKRRMWEEFLHKADGNNVWSIMTYTKPQRGTTVPTISHNGITATTLDEKASMLINISFPKPIAYEGSKGEPGPPGQAFRRVDSRLVASAFRGTSTKKSPGPDGVNPLAIR